MVNTDKKSKELTQNRFSKSAAASAPFYMNSSPVKAETSFF